MCSLAGWTQPHLKLELKKPSKPERSHQKVGRRNTNQFSGQRRVWFFAFMVVCRLFRFSSVSSCVHFWSFQLFEKSRDKWPKGSRETATGKKKTLHPPPPQRKLLQLAETNMEPVPVPEESTCLDPTITHCFHFFYAWKNSTVHCYTGSENWKKIYHQGFKLSVKCTFYHIHAELIGNQKQWKDGNIFCHFTSGATASQHRDDFTFYSHPWSWSLVQERECGFWKVIGQNSQSDSRLPCGASLAVAWNWWPEQRPALRYTSTPCAEPQRVAKLSPEPFRSRWKASSAALCSLPSVAAKPGRGCRLRVDLRGFRL